MEADNPVNPSLEWGVRHAVDADRPFILETWRRNYECSYASECPGGTEQYRRVQSEVIAMCMGSSLVTVAAPVERPEQIMGWVCYRRPDLVHYLYVKPLFRRAGVGTELLSQALGSDDDWPEEVYTTHSTERPGFRADGLNALLASARRKSIRVHWNPFLVFGGAFGACSALNGG